MLTAADALALRMTSLLLRRRPGADRAGAPGGDGPAALGDPGGPVGVAGVVEWFGAMRAQDMASGMWSLGVRLPGRTEADVHAALERAEAIRTWPTRGVRVGINARREFLTHAPPPTSRPSGVRPATTTGNPEADCQCASLVCLQTPPRT